MQTVPLDIGITDTTVTAVTVTAVTDPSGNPIAGVTVPFSLTFASNNWSGSFVDAASLNPAYYLVSLAFGFSDGSSIPIPPVRILPSALLAGAYGTIEDIISEMGSYNESVGSDPDATGDPSQIAANRQRAITFADSFINLRGLGHGCTIPLTSQLGATVSDALNVIFAKAGAYQLAQIRGWSEQYKQNDYQEKLDYATQALDQLLFMNAGQFAVLFSQAPVGAQALVDQDGITLPDPHMPPYFRPYWDGWNWVYA